MPIWNERNDIGLIFSGEDFIDPDEIRSLRARGHDIMPGSTSYLVHLYEENGSEFIGKLNGRFSGVVIDLCQQQTILFNDRYGLNRIYFSEKKGTSYFSSEAKSLLKILPEQRRLDFESLGETFAFGCVLQNRTLFPGISLVPGGSAWTFFPGQNVKKTQYFRPAVWENPPPLNAEKYYDDLRETWIRILAALYARKRADSALADGRQGQPNDFGLC